jgi:hypothetical protein
MRDLSNWLIESARLFNFFALKVCPEVIDGGLYLLVAGSAHIVRFTTFDSFSAMPPLAKADL